MTAPCAMPILYTVMSERAKVMKMKMHRTLTVARKERRLFRIGMAGLLGLIGALALAGDSLAAHVDVITIDSPIGPVTNMIVENAIDAAKEGMLKAGMPPWNAA